MSPKQLEGDGGILSTGMNTEDLVLAVTSVAGSTTACASHGDVRTVEVLIAYYAMIAEGATSAGGRVIKVMGDAVLVTFPVARARDAVATLRSLQAGTNDVWRRFDERCRVEVKVGVGRVVCAPFGPSMDGREDVYGDALNQLFKRPSGEFTLTPELEALLK